MSLLMDALKRAEKAKSRGNTAASLPIESVVSPLVEKNDHPEKKKESLMLEPVIKTGQDSEKEVELTFAIDNVEPLIGSTDTSESLFASDMSLFSVTPEQESKIINEPLSVEKKEVKAADINNKSTGVTTALFEKSVMTDQVSATPLQSPSDKVTADVNASLVRPQVPIMIGQPRFNRNYLWGGLLILCFVAGLGYYFQALNSFDSVGMIALPVINDVNTDIDDAPSEIVADLVDSVASTSVVELAENSPNFLSVVKKTNVHMTDIPMEKPVVSSSEGVQQREQSPVPVDNKKQNFTVIPKIEATPVEKSSPLQIDKVVVADPLQGLLQSAYNAYGAGDLTDASMFYRQVQSREADNRDALLGLAVIAQHQGNPGSARSFYERMLILNPKDSVAVAGMVSLNDGSVTTQGVSRLKLLLQEEPTAAHLHFFLANEYAAQSRWPEAQQSYFQAYHHSPTQSDYAFNLAVSLEKLGQSQVALEYYRRALVAADKSTPSFDVQRLVQRIDTLTAR